MQVAVAVVRSSFAIGAVAETSLTPRPLAFLSQTRFVKIDAWSGAPTGLTRWTRQVVAFSRRDSTTIARKEPGPPRLPAGENENPPVRT